MQAARARLIHSLALSFLLEASSASAASLAATAASAESGRLVLIISAAVVVIASGVGRSRSNDRLSGLVICLVEANDCGPDGAAGVYAAICCGMPCGGIADAWLAAAAIGLA